MKIVRHTDANFSQKLREVTAPSSLFDPVIEERTRAIIDAVQTRGDDALLEFTEKFDGARLTASQLAVTQAELMAASLKADESLRAAVAEAEKNVASFARKSLLKNWQMKNSHGATVGEKFDPFQRVGAYIPGGKAPLVSTVLMNRRLHALWQGWFNQSRPALCGAGGRGNGDLPRGRRAGNCGHGLRHEDNSTRAENFRSGQRLCRHRQAIARRPRRD